MSENSPNQVNLSGSFWKCEIIATFYTLPVFSFRLNPARILHKFFREKLRNIVVVYIY
jgi:hypothetical protein